MTYGPLWFLVNFFVFLLPTAVLSGVYYALGCPASNAQTWDYAFSAAYIAGGSGIFLYSLFCFALSSETRGYL